MTISRDGALQLFVVPPAKCFTELISQNYLEESLSQIISEACGYSNDANQDENRNPHFQYPDEQILGIQKVVPCRFIPVAPASPCNEHDCHQWLDSGTMSLREILFGIPNIQKASESGDTTDARGNSQDVPMDEDSALIEDCNGYAAAESEDEIAIETIPQSPMANQTRSTSRKLIVP
jgi:hypothetical protein